MQLCLTTQPQRSSEELYTDKVTSTLTAKLFNFVYLFSVLVLY